MTKYKLPAVLEVLTFVFAVLAALILIAAFVIAAVAE